MISMIKNKNTVSVKMSFNVVLQTKQFITGNVFQLIVVLSNSFNFYARTTTLITNITFVISLKRWNLLISSLLQLTNWEIYSKLCADKLSMCLCFYLISWWKLHKFRLNLINKLWWAHHFLRIYAKWAQNSQNKEN